MNLPSFKLERFFAEYEFSTPYLLCCSDCEALSLQEMLALADSDSIRLWTDLKLGYTESKGNPLLREEVAKLYYEIDSGDILIVTPEEGIFIAMHTLLEPGDHVITTFPGYQSLYSIAESKGCRVDRWMPDEAADWMFRVSDLEGIITGKTKMLVINFPHNPTGATITEQELIEIVEIAKKHNIIIFSDEMYRFLEYESYTRLPAVCDLYENGISLFGMSKTFALPGLRIGWLAAANGMFMQVFENMKDYTTICSSAPGEILAIMGLRAMDKIISRNMNIIRENLTFLQPFFEKYADFLDWHMPKAGPICFPKLKTGQDAENFCIDLARKRGVLLLPASRYDYSGSNFRLGFARKNMPEALKQFEMYIREAV